MQRVLNREEIEYSIAFRYVGAHDFEWRDDGGVSFKYLKIRDMSKMYEMEKELAQLNQSTLMQQGAINFANAVIMDAMASGIILESDVNGDDKV